MISAGNDIVALDVVDKQRTIQPRFYSKILSLSEQTLYREDIYELSFERYVWLLWSIKEAVYKYGQRLEPGLVFSPLKIVIQELKGTAPCCGVVRSGSCILYSRSTIHDRFISTVVSSDPQFEGVRAGVAPIDSTDRDAQSASVRALLFDKLYSLLPAGGGDLRVDKRPDGCPLLYQGEEKMNIPVSLAHHGHFVAYSFRLD